MRINIFDWLIIALFHLNSMASVCEDREPTATEKKQLELYNQELDPSFNIIPAVRGQTLNRMLRKIRRGPKKNRNKWLKKQKSASFETPLALDTACPKEINASAVHQMDRSSCPWYPVLNYDSHRWPKLMTFARCKCEHCVRKSTLYPKAVGVSSNICKPVYFYLYVLRRRCVNGQYRYYVVPERVANGCSCVVPNKKFIKM